MSIKLPNGKVARTEPEQVGYLSKKLAQLIEQAEAIQQELQRKLTKTSEHNKVYGTDNSGNQALFPVDTGVTGNVVRRKSDGRIIVVNPVDPEDGANKYYVDYLFSTFKTDSYQIVNTTTYPTLADFLASTGEAGFMYLYPVNPAQAPLYADGFYRYIYEGSQWIPMGKTIMDISGLAVLSGDNTFTGDNTFSGNNIFNEFLRTLGGVGTYTSNLNFNVDGFIPNGNGTRNWGSSTRQFKDGYFNGQVYAKNTYNEIDAIDILNNTLSQEQYDLFTNGKPILIKGTIQGYVNPIITNIKAHGNLQIATYIAYSSSSIDFIAGRCVILADNTIRFDNNVFSINTNSEAITFKGKTIPAYPASTGTFVLKCIDGTLTWVAE